MDESLTQPATQEKENKRKCGSFWVKIGKEGNKFLSGRLNLKNITGVDEEISVFLFKNEEKHTVKSPDFDLVLTNDEILKRDKSNKEVF